MDPWSVAIGVVTGLVIAFGGVLVVTAAVVALFRWATEFVTPEDPNLADEDEIDHRFY